LLSIPLDDLRNRAEALAGRLQEIKGLAQVQVRQDESFVGGGSLPDQALASWVVELQANDLSEAELAYRLRTSHPAVVGRTRDNQVVLDLRTIFPHQEKHLVEVVKQIFTRPVDPAR
jgi:L-seryl-tRNA(Ser) seleniumtransferase